ncbi:MAG: methyltransferase domain-containing protein [Bdellovibrionota bacterium]
MVNTVKASSVSDFSEQWSSYTTQQGYYASPDMLQDYFGPLMKLEDLKGCRVCEIGSGNGRFISIMSQYADEVVGLEPSEAVEVSRQYNKDNQNVTHVNKSIYDADKPTGFDYVFCLGVLHHTGDPIETVKQIKSMLKPDGKAVIWVYGKEGNGLYLALYNTLSFFTKKMPHKLLVALSKLLTYPLMGYIALARKIPMPMRNYMVNVLGKYSFYELELTIYDQLNPSVAAYWTKAEFSEILRGGGLNPQEFYHRHEYSWTAVSSVA